MTILVAGGTNYAANVEAARTLGAAEFVVGPAQRSGDLKNSCSTPSISASAEIYWRRIARPTPLSERAPPAETE